MADLRPKRVVALFNASDDTVDMVERMLGVAGFHSLVWCHFVDVKKGHVDFAQYLDEQDPHVVIFDISPPYDENWQFYKTLRSSKAMEDRGLVLTTTNKARLDEAAGEDSLAIELVGRPFDLQEIMAAIEQESRRAATRPETPVEVATELARAGLHRRVPRRAP